MVAATLVGLDAGQRLGGATVDSSLTALRSSGSFDVTAQLQSYRRLAGLLAASPQAATAMDGFSAAVSELPTSSQPEYRADRLRLLDEYEERFIEPLRAAGDTVAVAAILSTDPAAVYLQSAYSLPESPIPDPILVDDVGDGTAWSEVHARFHPVYRNAVTQAGLLDVYLVDSASGRIVYSAAKGPELGTSLLLGPYRGTVVGRAAEAAISGGTATVSDLDSYKGVPGVPVGAAAAPVLDGGTVVGAIVLTYDGSVYTDLLTSVVAATTGAGERVNDLYLIGTDGTVRSDPPSYLADPAGFLDASVEAGVLPPSDRTVIEAIGTTVLVQPAVDSTVNAALDGDTSVSDTTSMTGSDVVQALERVPVDGVEWYAVAELDGTAAQAPLASFRNILVVGAAVFVVALAFIAVAWSDRIMRPVRVISDRLGEAAIARATSSESEPVAIPDSSATEFHRLADSFSSMAESLRRRQAELREARAERLDVAKRMLPASVAQRIARGDVESLEEVPSTTVVVVVVLGLGGLVDGENGGGHRLLDELAGELDDIAFEHGLERIKVVGDSYFGVCGHDRPYLDHAPRAVAFAEDVTAAVRSLARASSAGLSTAIAVNSGPVTVGMSGGARLVYDVWGPTVTVAHNLARVARAGEIVVTDATRARLPEEVELRRWEGADPAAGRDEAGGPDGALWTVVVLPDGRDAPSVAEASP
jgi:class 3 adenylate cyclase